MFNDLIKALDGKGTVTFSISKDGKANLAVVLSDGCKTDETVLVTAANAEAQVNYLIKRALLSVQNHNDNG